MNFLVNVNQSAALRAGIDAPSSTVTLAIDPATLSAEERNLLASLLTDGHDLTRRTFAIADDGEGRAILRTSTGHGQSLEVVLPTVDGLRQALAAISKSVADYQRELDRELDRERAEARAKLDAALVDVSTEDVSLTLRNGKVGIGNHPQISTVRRLPTVPYLSQHHIALLGPEECAKWESFRAAREAAVAVIMEGARPELEAQVAAVRQREEREKNELLLLLTEEQRERYAADRLPEGEIRKVLSGLLPHALAAEQAEPSDSFRIIDGGHRMTAAQFAVFKRLSDWKLEGADVQLGHQRKEYFRDATEYEVEAGLADSDGEVPEVKGITFTLTVSRWGVRATRSYFVPD
jgi:hypothetical protein